MGKTCHFVTANVIPIDSGGIELRNVPNIIYPNRSVIPSDCQGNETHLNYSLHLMLIVTLNELLRKEITNQLKMLESKLVFVIILGNIFKILFFIDKKIIQV